MSRRTTLLTGIRGSPRAATRAVLVIAVAVLAALPGAQLGGSVSARPAPGPALVELRATAPRGGLPGAPPPSPPGIQGASVLAQIPVESQPTNVTVDPANGYLYVTNFGTPVAGGNTVSILNGTTNAALATIHVGDDPIASVYDPTDGYVYTMNFGTSNNVSIFHDTSLVTSVTVGTNPRAAVYDPADGWVYTANQGSGNVTVLNGTSIIATIAVGTSPGFPTYDTADGDVYVPNYGSGTVSVLNGTSVVATVAVGSAPTSASYDSLDSEVYVPNSATDNVSILHGTVVSATAAVGVFPQFTGFDASNGYVYVPNSGSNNITILDGYKVIANVPAGSSPRWPDYDPANGFEYVTDWASSQVTVLNGTGVLATVAVGTNPYALTFVPHTQVEDTADFNTANLTEIGNLNSAYSVEVTESGLASGTPWGAELGATTYETTAPNLTAPEANGTLSYSIPPVPGYLGNLPPGNVSVHGNHPMLHVAFVRTYPVTFTETGLPSGWLWNVTVNGTSNESTTPAINFTERNGTYNYSIAPEPGYRFTASSSFRMSGAAVVVPTSFTLLDYDVGFNETGLPSGSRWGVTVNGTWLVGPTPRLLTSLPNGTYAYSVTPVPGYVTNWTGHVRVSGGAVNVTIAFRPMEYTAAFVATGLPPRTNWTLTVDGAPQTSSSPKQYRLPNGTYNYSVTPIPGFELPSWSGSVQVDGNDTITTLLFAPVLYWLAFTESGLAAGTSWDVTVLGQVTMSSTTTGLAFVLPNGTYTFGVPIVDGYRPVAGAQVRIDGSNQSLHLVFVPVLYDVRLVATGLPETRNWTLGIAGGNYTSSGGEVDLRLINGTYPYSIRPIAGWSTVWNGSVTVYGADRNVSVLFSEVTYVVGFDESGLPNGTSWGVTVAGAWFNGTSSTLWLREPNGSFAWNASSIPGFTTTSRGMISVNGSSPAAVTVNFTASGSSGGGSSALSGGWEIDLAIGLVVVLLAAGAGAWLYWRRRRGESTPPSEPTVEP